LIPWNISRIDPMEHQLFTVTLHSPVLAFVIQYRLLLFSIHAW